MRLLIDQNLAQRVAAGLREAGHDAVHVAERGMQRAEDVEILELASAEGRIIVSEDTDFGALLTQSRAIAPSFVLLRGSEPVTPEGQVAVLLANLPALEEELEKGAIVVFSRGRIRIRPMPVRPQE